MSSASLPLTNFSCPACIVFEIFGLKKCLKQKGKVNCCNETMELQSKNQFLVNMIEKVIYCITLK